MVSKIAVIALVAIVACPILLGYGMNLTEVSVTDYKNNNDTVNVTQYLSTGTAWKQVHGDIYQLNSNTTIAGGYYDYSHPLIPVYNKVSSVVTSVPMYQNHVPNWTGGGAPLSGVKCYEVNIRYTPTNSQYVSLQLYHDSTLLSTIPKITYFYWDAATTTLYYEANYTISKVTVPTLNYLYYTFTGMSSADLYYYYVNSTTNTSYADLSAGYYFVNSPAYIALPENTTNAVMTVNLDSITNSSYSFTFGTEGVGTGDYVLKKTTAGGVVKWTIAPYSNQSDTTELYYDPTRIDNTYQIYFELVKDYSTASQDYYIGHTELRYVGGWPSLIGTANAYKTYTFETNPSVPINSSNGIIHSIYLENNSGRTPTLRMDDALINAYEIQIIADKTYQPAEFKSNPATTIKDVAKYGKSLIFGGNTYTVDGTNITINGHQIPINNMVLDSIPNELNNGYLNRINGTVVSETVQPSTISFVGDWSASVSTASMVSYTYNKTEWTPGQFAWNGIDQNFLMVGLLTSLGAFIALGIYIRRTKANLWPLLIVCGGAAMLFFCML